MTQLIDHLSTALFTICRCGIAMALADPDSAGEHPQRWGESCRQEAAVERENQRGPTQRPRDGFPGGGGSV